MQFYDIDGKPIDTVEWGHLAVNPRYCRVARTQLGKVWVSTVWIGFEQRALGVLYGEDPVTNPPCIFETMVFPDCEYRIWTPTKQAALAAHDQATAHVREQTKPSKSATRADDLPAIYDTTD
jgi:hypothetical protein